MPSKQLPILPIIVLFNNRTRRNEYYIKRKLLKGTTSKDLKELNFTENQPLFINESLTLFNRILFKNVREACKKQHCKFFWTNNGISMCKKNFQSDVVIMKAFFLFSFKKTMTMTDLKKFPCGVCLKTVANNHNALCCDSCYKWIHIKCNFLNKYTYKKLQKGNS